MKKEVLLTIRAEQRFRDEEPEMTELVTEGQLSVRRSRVEFSYDAFVLNNKKDAIFYNGAAVS